MAAVADHKGIRAEKLEARVERHSVEATTWRTAFTVHVDVGAGLTPRERKILYNAARYCEVHKLLAGELSFMYQQVEDA